MSMSLSQESAARLRKSLLSWFDEKRRDLPWRTTRDPYAVWVSEVMLQQTQVNAVRPYYSRFLTRFPTLERLADAPLDEVLSCWSGLGYYRRARLLHRGVQEVRARYGGRVPSDAEELLSLPGVGDYTAAAISSIAYNAPRAAVDGNVSRVYSRLAAIRAPLGTAGNRSAVRDVAEGALDQQRPGDFNQALMDLGATVCTKAHPRCSSCPLEPFCQARAKGLTEQLPVAKRRTPTKAVAWTAVVALQASNTKVLLVRQQAELFGGTWTPPLAEGEGEAAARAAVAAAGLSPLRLENLKANVTHVLSHRKLHVALWRAEVQATQATLPSHVRFIALDKLHTVGVSALTRKILKQANFS